MRINKKARISIFVIILALAFSLLFVLAGNSSENISVNLTLPLKENTLVQELVLNETTLSNISNEIINLPLATNETISGETVANVTLKPTEPTQTLSENIINLTLPIENLTELILDGNNTTPIQENITGPIIELNNSLEPITNATESIDPINHIDPIGIPEIIVNQTIIIPEPSLFSTVLSLLTQTFAYIGDLINVRATLTYENLTPISGQNIDFYADEYLGSDITNDEGIARINWDTSNIPPGTYGITANYSGSDSYISSTNTVIVGLQEIVNESLNETVNASLDVDLTNISLKNSRGKKVNANFKVLKKIKAKGLGITAINEKFDLEVIPETGPIKKLLLQNVDLTSETTLGLEELPKTFPSPLGEWAQVYAIDPTKLNFTQGVVTVEAKGSNLYKCKDYDFENQNCFGEWSLFKSNLVPGQEYTFILTAQDPVFGESVTTCSAENSAAKGTFGSACDAADGSLLESNNGLVETQTFGKGEYSGLRIQSVNTSITTCGGITTVVLCYERWTTNAGGGPDDCDISVDADGGGSYTAVTTVCPGTAANPGVTCTDVSALETFVCGSFFGVAGTRALAKMENDRVQSGGPTTETLSTDVFFFNVTYTLTDNILPSIDLVAPLISNGSIQAATSATINITLVDETGVGNCTLEWNGVNETMPETSISATSKECLTTKTGLSDGTYNFTVYGNDTGNNVNNTANTVLEVDATSPTIDFVDPSESTGTFSSLNQILVNVTSVDTNLINITTYLYNATALVNSTLSTTSPHYLNFSALADSIYYFNATAYDNVSNNNFTATRNFTVDTIFPAVFGLIPAESSSFNPQTIEIATNVTDNNPDTVQANITYPNGTLNLLTLSLYSGEKYNNSFTIPNLPGIYNITIYANDSAGNGNNSVTTNFTTNDIFAPSVNITSPAAGSNFGQKNNVTINVNVTDQLVVDTVLANVTHPNGTIIQQTLTAVNGIYEGEFNETTITGTYTILTIANDTDNNVNNTVTRNFNVQDSTVPLVTLIAPLDTTTLSISTVDFSCNVTDNSALVNITFYHNISGTLIANQTKNATTAFNQTNFTVNTIPDGTYEWNCLAEDDSANTAFAVNNFTFSMDTTPPSVTALAPANTKTFIQGETVIINATVIDSFSVSQVIANITLPNGSLTQINLGDDNADDIFNATYLTLITGVHNITFMANDSQNNANNTETTFFNVTLVPNITLEYPLDNSTLNFSTIGFNFTVTDDGNNLANCSLFTNISGMWRADNNITDVNNGTSVNITKDVPDGTFSWNVECTDHLGYGNFSAANFTLTINTTVQGIFVYQELDNQTPLYRIWNENNISGNEKIAPTVTGDMTWLTIHGNHERKEFIMGTEDKQNDLNILIFNTTERTWGNLLQVSSDLSNSGFRGFDIAYEEISGDALIAYENSATADSTIGYRIWNGTDFSNEQNFTTALTAAPISWVELVEDKRSDDIMLLVHNNVGDFYAVPWNGTGFDYTKNATLSTSTVSNTEQHFSFAWEESSNEGLIFYGEGTNLVYRTYNSTDSPYWGSENTISLGDSLDSVRTCSDKDSDHIGLIYQLDLTQVNVSIWNGSEFLSAAPIGDTATEANGANNINTDCIWLNSTTAMFGFVDTNSLAMDYVTFSKPNTWSADLTSASTTSNFASDDISSLRFTLHPTTQDLIITSMDIAEDLSAIRWDGVDFKTIYASPFEQSTEVLNGDQEGFMFDWLRFDQIPEVTNLSLNSTTVNSGDTVNVSVNVTDDISISTVLANVTLSGNSVQEINLTKIINNVYSGTITSTTGAGTYTVTIVAQDNGTHQNINQSETTTFVVPDTVPPTVSWTAPDTNTNYSKSSSNQTFNVSIQDSAIETVLLMFNNGSGIAFNVTATNFSGDWTAQYNVSLLAEGTNTVTVYANDTSANTNNTEAITITTDYAAPLVTWLTVTNNTNYSISSSNQTFNVTVTDTIAVDSVIFQFDNASGNSFNLTTANFSGDWAVQYNVSSLTEGINIITVYANDTVGNTNSTESITITTDYTFPAVSWTNPNNGSYFSITSNNQTFNSSISDTNIETVLFMFDNSTGISFNLTPTNYSGDWAVQYNVSSLTEGTNTITVYANDTVGNTNNTQRITITTDYTFPVVSWTSPSDNTNYSVISSNQTFNTSISDANIETVLFMFNNGTGIAFNVTATNSSGDWIAQYNVSLLAEGTNTVTVYSNDTSGNTNNSEAITITIDFTAPTVTWLTPANNSLFSITSSNQTFNTTVTDTNDVNEVIFQFNNGTGIAFNKTSSNFSGNWAVQYNVSELTEGTNTITIYANDTLGNTNSTQSITIDVDFSIPQVTWVAPVNNSNFSLTSSNQTFNVSINELSPDTVIFMFNNGTGTAFNVTSTNNSGYWTAQYNVSLLAEGTNTVTVYANDTSGNTNNTVENTINTDYTYPTVSWTSPNNNSNFSIASSNQTFTTNIADVGMQTVLFMFNNGTGIAFNVTATNSSGDWSAQYNVSLLAQGTNTITVYANDTVGYTNNSEIITITTDYTSPSIDFSNPTTLTGNFSQSFINVNITASDTNNINTINITIYNTTNLVMGNFSTASPFFLNLTSLPDGVYSLNASVNDSADNKNTTTQTRNITLDTTVPVVTLISPANNTLETTTNSFTLTYNVTDVTSQIINCSLYINGTFDQVDTTITKDINQSFTKTLNNGNFTWNVTCFDSAINEAPSTTFNLNVSVSGPTTTLDSPTNYFNSSNTLVNFTCSTIDDNSLANISISIWNYSDALVYNNSVNISGVSNSSNWSTTLDANQNYTWNCQSYDGGGLNDWGNVNRTFTIDTVSPTIDFADPTTLSGNFSQNFISVNVTSIDDRDISTINITIYNETNLVMGNFSSTSPFFLNLTSLPDDTYYLNASVNDSAGNINTTSTTRTITLDTATPTVGAVTSSPNAPIYNNGSEQNVSVNFTTSEYPVNITFNLYNSSGDVVNSSGQTTINTASDIPKEFNISEDLTDGNYSLNFTITDPSENNVETNVGTIVVDSSTATIGAVTSSPPTPLYNNGTEQNISVNFTTSEYPVNITFNLYNSSGSVVNTSGPFTINNAADIPKEFNISSDLTEANYSLNFSIIDPSGNTVETTIGNIVIDTTSPTIDFASPTTVTGNFSQSFINVNVSVTDENYFGTINITIYNNTDLVMGNFSTTSPFFLNLTSLPDDTYYLNASVNDSAGNINTTSIRNITLDTLTPTIGAVTSSPTTPLNNNGSEENISVNFTTSEYPVNITFNLYNSSGSVVNSSGPTTINTASDIPKEFNISGDLTDGNHSLNFTITDPSSNSVETNVGTIVVDSSAPLVVGLIPVQDTAFNLQAEVEVAVNVTDAISLSIVSANITLPNGSTQLLTLANSLGDKFNASFLNTSASGTYNITFIANDTLNNINNTQTTNFTTNDNTAPTITPVGCTPSSFNLDASTQCIATVTDNVGNGVVLANVTLPNGTHVVQTVTNISDNYFFNFTNASFVGVHNVVWLANDTSGNKQNNTDTFNVTDVTSPSITLNLLNNNTNTSNPSPTFTFNVTDNFYTALNCSIYINNTLNQTNVTSLNGSQTSMTINGFNNGHYSWNVTCLDNSSNTNTSETRIFIVDNLPVTFVSLTTSPTGDANLDPNINITVLANITDNVTAVDTAILQYKLSTSGTYTNLTMTYDSGNGFYNATFNATQNGIYNLRLTANDSAGNINFSSIVNITVEFDKTWTRTPSAFTPITTTLDSNVTLGNLTINNTGDFAFNFTVLSDSNDSIINESWNYSSNFVLQPKEVIYLQVYDNATNSGVKTVTLNITLNDSTASPTSLTTTGTMVVAPGQPILLATFTTPNTENLSVTQKDVNVEFSASLKNLGEGNASNVTLFLEIPDDWTVTFGQVNASFSTLDSGVTETISIEVTIPAGASTGDKTVVANATAINASGIDLHTVDLIFEDKVTVNVAAVASILGVEVVTPAATSQESSSSAVSSGASGGGGGSLPSAVKTVETFEVKRGTSETEYLEVKNIYTDSLLTNVRLELTGFLAQYVTWEPEVLEDIPYLEAKRFQFSIKVPAYFTASDYELTAKITGDIVAADPDDNKFVSRTMEEFRTILLKIIEFDTEDISTELALSTESILAMKNANFPISRVSDLFAQAQLEIGNNNYNLAKDLLDQINQIKDEAFQANDLIKELETSIKEAKSKGLKTPKTLEELELAKLAFAREDFTLAIERAQNGQLVYVLETKGKINILKFTKTYWWELIAAMILATIILIFSYKKLLLLIVRRRIHNLIIEEDKIGELIKETQKNYIKYKIISSDQFKRSIDHYENRLVKIKKIRIKLRNRRAYLLDTKKELIGLNHEKKELTSSLKKTQHDYFVKMDLPRGKFIREYESHKGRIGEVEEEKRILKIRLKKENGRRKLFSLLKNISSFKKGKKPIKKKKKQKRITIKKRSKK